MQALRFVRTEEHAPEPGLGGAHYAVRDHAAMIGWVASRWDRTNGVHWTAMKRNGAPVTDGRRAVPRAFTSRAAAAAALARAHAEVMGR
jgi:hypothetical protein